MAITNPHIYLSQIIEVMKTQWPNNRTIKLSAMATTHAIQVGTPMQNIIAMYKAAGSLQTGNDEILALGTIHADNDSINLSKLF